VPLGAETCGPVVTDDLLTVCVQHPGENDDNIDNPLSRWPEGDNGHGTAVGGRGVEARRTDWRLTEMGMIAW
jgi:secreted PhoX family phosphatase